MPGGGYEKIPIFDSTSIHIGDSPMTLDEFRHQLEMYRQTVNDEADSQKDSYLALARLHNLFQEFDSEERAMADQVLAEWALSNDENVRFDVLSLIDKFHVVTARSALETLASRLAVSIAPGAPYELEKVNRILRDLTEHVP